MSAFDSPLAHDGDDGNDYTMRDDYRTCWIRVGETVLWVRKGFDGVHIDLFRRGEEDGTPVDTAFMAYEYEEEKA